MSQMLFNILGSMGSWAGTSGGANAEYRIDASVVARIRRLPEDALKALADALAERASENAPTRTGALARSIRARRIKSKSNGTRIYYSVGTRTKAKVVSKSGRRRGYGAPVEFGHFMRTKSGRATRWIEGDPFLRPARVWVAQNVDSILTAAGVPLK